MPFPSHVILSRSPLQPHTGSCNCNTTGERRKSSTPLPNTLLSFNQVRKNTQVVQVANLWPIREQAVDVAKQLPYD